MAIEFIEIWTKDIPYFISFLPFGPSCRLLGRNAIVIIGFFRFAPFFRT